jgi:hypothetical protein
MTNSHITNRSTDPPHEAPSDVTFGGKDTPFTRKDTPSSLRIYSHTLACHPFPLRAKGNKKLYVEFPFIHKGVPNLLVKAGYPYSYICNNAVMYAHARTYKTKFYPPPIARMPYNTP